MTQKDYNEFIRQSQAEHLKEVAKRQGLREMQARAWSYPQIKKPETKFVRCFNAECSQCKGTGIKLDGSACIHYIACPCPRCSVKVTCSTEVQ